MICDMVWPEYLFICHISCIYGQWEPNQIIMQVD